MAAFEIKDGAAIIPEGTTVIPQQAFCECLELISITIPDSVTIIEAEAFLGCENIVSVIISRELKHIESGAFCGCISLESINLPNGIMHINEGAFNSCSTLQSIIIPNSVIYIGDVAFANCQSLKFINVPMGISSIDDLGECAFAGCTSLSTVAIPKHIEALPEDTFEDCRGFSIIRYEKNIAHISIEGTDYIYAGLYDNGGESEDTTALYCDEINDITISINGQAISDKSVLDHLNSHMGTADNIIKETISDELVAIRLTQLLGQTKSCIVEFDGEFDPMKLQLNIGYCKFNLGDDEFSDDEPLLLSISYDGVEYPLNHDKYKQGYESSEIIWGEDPDSDEGWEDEE